MALAWTVVSPAVVASISTTELFSTSISVDPNQGLSADVSISTHANDSITATVYVSNDGGTNWATLRQVLIPAGDVDSHNLGVGILTPHVRFGFLASGSADTPTATMRVKRGPLNSAYSLINVSLVSEHQTIGIGGAFSHVASRR